MPLTVKDILEKTFKRSFKGYDEDEVDKFLDQLIDEFKMLQNEVASLKNELAASKESVEKVKHSEEIIMNTLVSAQKTSERMVGEAKHKAEIIISSAEATAKQKKEKTLRELDEAKSKIDELKNCAQGFAASFANMVNAQAAYFEKTYRSYFGQDLVPLGGINADALEKIDQDISRSLGDMDVSQKEKHEDQGAPPETGNEAGVEDQNSGGEDYMELFEINKKLNDMENGDIPPEHSDGGNETLKSKQYGDYSWIYDNDGKAKDQDVAIKDPKDKEELKSLIEEIIE